jgi:hypothetical protein
MGEAYITHEVNEKCMKHFDQKTSSVKITLDTLVFITGWQQSSA